MFFIQRLLSSRTQIGCLGFFSPIKLYKKESAGKMAIKFHLSLLEHFFLSFDSAKQENSLGIVASK